MRFLLLGLLFATSLFAKMPDLSSPQKTLLSYHHAIQEGDIQTLKAVMVEESFHTDMQVYALSIALQDTNFHTILKHYGQSDEARKIVQKAVAKKLKSRKNRTISDLKMTKIGKNRVMIRFKEDGKKKQLYVSKEGTLWKMNYKAGRRTQP